MRQGSWQSASDISRFFTINAHAQCQYTLRAANRRLRSAACVSGEVNEPNFKEKIAKPNRPSSNFRSEQLVLTLKPSIHPCLLTTKPDTCHPADPALKTPRRQSRL